MKDAVKRRRNFFPTVILALFFWIGWAIIFFRIPPGIWFSFLLFYLILFMALFLTFALIMGNSRRGFFLTIAILGFLILRQIELDSILNLLLLWGSLIALEFYLTNNH